MDKKFNIILIGPGKKPIPPVGWGAIESLIWDYYENLKKNENINVQIINDSNIHRVIYNCNKLQPDVIHIMYDDYINMVPFIRCKRILYTSHYACITHPDFQQNHQQYFMNIFMKVIQYKNRIELNSISPFISEIYQNYGFDGTINNICNGAREDLFRFTTSPNLPCKSIYVAKVEIRKCQYKYQSIPDIDFVGNYHDSPFDRSNTNYLGEWNKAKLYETLTDYGNLVLLSKAEADPLVVKEALIAGLGLVISACCVANLDLSQKFITVIPDDKLDDLHYIRLKIFENRVYSVLNRQAIRSYALSHFAWSSIINKYTELLYIPSTESSRSPSTFGNNGYGSAIVKKNLKEIVLVGPGILPIPPQAWGAVEILIWDYSNELIKRGYNVTIINTKNVRDIIDTVNKKKYDFVHIHYDKFHTIIPFLKCPCIALTSHYPYIDKLEYHQRDGYDSIFIPLIVQKSFYNFVLADKDKNKFISCGADPTRIKKIKNGINSSLFKFKEANYNNRTMYLGKITPRKNQHVFQNIENIDFVGNCDDTRFDKTKPNYLGEWSRDKIYSELTNYSNLLLMSQGEADPLVVKEALIAGLGVVINRSSAENLDTNIDFITIIEDDKMTDIEYIVSKIEENKNISNHNRNKIREYGISKFDISIEVDKYLEVIQSIL